MLLLLLLLLLTMDEQLLVTQAQLHTQFHSSLQK